MTTFARVRRALLRQRKLKLTEASVTLESDISADLGVDSLQKMELIIALEDEFAVSIEDIVVDQFKTVEDIVRHIDSLT